MNMSKNAQKLLLRCYEKYRDIGERQFSYTPGNEEQLTAFLAASQELFAQSCLIPLSGNFEDNIFELTPDLGMTFDIQITEFGIQLAASSSVE